MGAFIIPFFFFGVALFCLKIKKVKLLRLFFITVFGCILISVFFSFVFSFTGVDRLFGTSAGGSYGFAVNKWLKTMLGTPGTAAILILAIVGWCIIINKSLIRKISGGFEKVGQKLEQATQGAEDTGDLEGEDMPEGQTENESEEIDETELETDGGEDMPEDNQDGLSEEEILERGRGWEDLGEWH